MIRARSLDRARTGSNMLAKMAIMAMTTSNSIKVKASDDRPFIFLFLLLGPYYDGSERAREQSPVSGGGVGGLTCDGAQRPAGRPMGQLRHALRRPQGANAPLS